MSDWKKELESEIDSSSSTYTDWDYIGQILSELETAGCGNSRLVEFSNYLYKKYAEEEE